MKAYHLLPDVILLQLIKRSNQQAFAALYDRYWEKLFATALQRVHQVTECEDIVHEVFLSLWKNRHTNEITHVNAYLASAVKFKTISFFRKKSTESIIETSTNLDLLHIPSEEQPIEEKIHQRYLLEKFYHKLEELPPQCQLIFRYSRIDELKNKEIANKLNISPRTVENQLTKALKALRPHFK